MRINDCIYVALYDIRQKKSFSIQMIKGLLLIISLLLFSLIIAFGIHSFYEETITDCGNLNYAVYIPDRNTNENVLSENDKKTIETIFSNVPLESIVDYAELDIPQMCGMGDKNLISMKSVSLETDGKRYYGIDSTEFRKNTLSVLAIESGYQVHSKYKLDFFKLHNPNKNAVIRGRMPEKAGEFVIDDIFMSQLGFSAESISDILGTQCTFCIDGKECTINEQI